MVLKTFICTIRALASNLFYSRGHMGPATLAYVRVVALTGMCSNKCIMRQHMNMVPKRKKYDNSDFFTNCESLYKLRCLDWRQFYRLSYKRV